MRQNSFIYDLQTNPAVAEKNLVSNAYGFDIEKLKSAGETFDREIKRIQADNEDTLTEAYLKGELDESTIMDMKDKKFIRPDFAKSMIKTLQGGTSVQTDPLVYEDLMDMIVSDGSKASDIRTRLMEEMEKKNLTQGDFESLYYAKKVGRDTSVYEDYYDETHKENPFWKAAISALKNFSVSTSDFGWQGSFVELMRSFLGKTKQQSATPEKLPKIAIDTLKEKIIAENPSISNLKDVPNASFNTNGIKPLLEGGNEAESQFVFQNGRIVPVKKKE
jgi:hypothetical protein